MKINFTKSRFEALLKDAKTKGCSIPSLLNEIIDLHYQQQSSHTKVALNERTVYDPNTR